MNTSQAIDRMREVLQRQHKALSTEDSYVFWLRRYMAALRDMPVGLPSEKKLEQFLTDLARRDVSASTQNQAFNGSSRSPHSPGRCAAWRPGGDPAVPRPVHSRPNADPAPPCPKRSELLAVAADRNVRPAGWDSAVQLAGEVWSSLRPGSNSPPPPRSTRIRPGAATRGS